MKIIGLTGSIGMGKSETAKMFAALGVPVFDADAAVHKLQVKNGRAIPAIDAAFPGVVADGVLDRQKLGAQVFADPEAKKRLEAIMHPMVADERVGFFADAEKQGAKFVILDIPLLFETGGNAACDKVVVVSAPADVQRARVLARPGMTVEKFEHILARQTPDADKRVGADYIVDTSRGLEDARAQVKKIVEELEAIS
ncbi:dephospho-CoA kinase [Kordiimonas marina]|uniref:dephospho-CoA kinase n=1 Tax=Kordiimonas marina TaxID=2872312 RepID=UPI001FF1D8E6|nr:dephospho-CoA kinase [Kordiimonas marina]MCJ9429861.1 dephospho-CoA kinase [Kordiimonas marina]